jgi:hypothetical protein
VGILLAQEPFFRGDVSFGPRVKESKSVPSADIAELRLEAAEARALASQFSEGSVVADLMAYACALEAEARHQD